MSKRNGDCSWLRKIKGPPAFPVSLLRDIQHYEPKLSVVWDWTRERWVVLFPNPEKPWKSEEVIVCQYDNGTYRPPDMRLLVQIIAADTQPHKNIGAFLKVKVDDHNAAIERAKMEKSRDNIRYVARNEGYRSWFGSKMVPTGIDLKRMNYANRLRSH